MKVGLEVFIRSCLQGRMYSHNRDPVALPPAIQLHTFGVQPTDPITKMI